MILQEVEAGEGIDTQDDWDPDEDMVWRRVFRNQHSEMGIPHADPRVIKIVNVIKRHP